MKFWFTLLCSILSFIVLLCFTLLCSFVQARLSSVLCVFCYSLELFYCDYFISIKFCSSALCSILLCAILPFPCVRYFALLWPQFCSLHSSYVLLWSLPLREVLLCSIILWVQDFNRILFYCILIHFAVFQLNLVQFFSLHFQEFCSVLLCLAVIPVQFNSI